MTQYPGLLLLACAVLTGCASSKPRMPSLFRVELPAVKASADPDIVATSLRPLERTTLPKLPKRVDRPDLALRLRNTYARLQLQLPVLPRRQPVQLTAVARRYWEPQSIGAPHGKFLLRLSLPLPFKQSWVKPRSLPSNPDRAGALPVTMGLADTCTNGALARGSKWDDLNCNETHVRFNPKTSWSGAPGSDQVTRSRHSGVNQPRLAGFDHQ